MRANATGFTRAYVKLAVPAWSRQGAPLPAWSASGYRHAAKGPLASAFHALAGSPPAGWTDLLVPIGLVLVRLSLTLGLFTQAGCSAALALLTLFYFAMIPVTGVPKPNGEGAYLIVRPPCASGRSGRAPGRCCHPRHRVTAVPHRVARWPPRRSQPPAGRPCGGRLGRRRGRSRLRRCWSPDQPLVRGCG